MSDSAQDGEVRAALHTIHTECEVLATLLNANRRSRVYRHHHFYRRTRHAMTLARKCFTGKGGGSAVTKTRTTKRRVTSLITLQRCLIRAAQDCTAELAANRIDTVALSLACLGVLSRLGCCVARVFVASTSRSAAARLWPADFVESVAQGPATALRASEVGGASETGGHRGQNVARDTYGGMLNAVVRRSASRKKK